MKRIVLFFLAFCLYGLSVAQNITAIEYFVDADPGAGAATAVSITAATTISKTFDVPITAIADGFHTLSIRAKDVNNKWGTTFTSPFYKLPPSVTTAPNINKLEYFIDADPGAGAATDVPVTAGISVAGLAVNVPITAVADGFHTITFRARNANNRWSTAFTSPFYKLPPLVATAPNINKLEYFIDADSSAGQGIDVPITAGTSVSGLVVNVPLSSVTDGFHTLTFRARDANGKWSHANTSPFYKLSASALAAAPNLTKLEYFIDNDPGVGAGTSLALVAATSITNFVFDVNVSALTTGQHKLSVRAMNANGQWSIVYVASIGIFGPPPVGQPTNATFTAVAITSYTVSYTAPATAPAGYLAIRKLGSAPTKDPVDGIVYAKGDNLGTDNFVAYVGSALTFPETGLTNDTKYYYKIYAYNGSTTLTNYLTPAPLEGSVTTLPDPVLITAESFPDTYNKNNSFTVSITVNSAAKASNVKIKYRGISDAIADLKTATLTASGNSYGRTFTNSEVKDGIGMKYYFEVTGLKGTVTTSNTGKSYVLSSQEPMPSLNFGNTVSNYQIIAVPLNLTDKSVTTVFNRLGGYDPTLWRLFDYVNGNNREFNKGFTTIEPGKGYWLIALNQTDVFPGEGTALKVDEATPHTIDLAPGWNLIGNPYNFKVSWADVLAASPTGLSTSITTYQNGTLTDGDVLDVYRGGFVQNTTVAPVTIKIPVLRNKTINGGRASSHQEIDLANQAWQVPISVSNGALTNARGGVGMNPLATENGKDNFDTESVPLLEGIGMPELSFPTSKKAMLLNKDVVRTQQNFSWQFELVNSESDELQLTWPIIDAKGDRELLLLDVESQRVVDMTKQNSFSVGPGRKALKIFFGDKRYIEASLEKEISVLGYPFPNPAQQELVHIPFYITEALADSRVTIKICNALGQEVAIVANSKFEKGFHSVDWKTTEAPGIYIIAMKVGNTLEKRVRVVVQ